MSNKDFQNGFAIGLASGGVVEVVDTTEIDNLETLIDNSGVLDSTEGTATEKVEELIDRVYVEYPLPQDDYVYYRYPPCNEDRYIKIGISSIEYGSLNADGYTKIGTMDGVNEDSYYKYIIPAHTKDFIIKLSSMPVYAQSNADCTEVSVGNISSGIYNRWNMYQISQVTINGLRKLTINKPINQQQHGKIFQGLPCQTINLQTINASLNSSDMFSNCIFLKDVKFEEMILRDPYSLFPNCNSLEAIDCSKIVPSGRIDNMFYGCTSLEILDLSSWAGIKFTNVNGLFRYCSNLKTLNLSGWDLSYITTLYDWFDGNGNLEDLILDNTVLFSASFSVSGCPKLTKESIAGIFNALPTITTAKTLTLHANAKILQSQVDSANAKGWTVAGGTVVSEEEYYG